MKRTGICIFLLLVLTSASAQNEFAGNAFYNEFKKIYEDAQSGFIDNKGDKRRSGIEELVTEYKVKWMLPLADSGKLVIPVNGNPYAIYYFEPGKTRLRVDQRAMELREAVTIAFNKPLFIRTVTTIVNDKPLSTTSYYGDENMEGPMLFRQTVYYQSGKFYTSLEVKGKKL
jgi:hypothetical protein